MNMDKMQRKELQHAVSTLKRAESARAAAEKKTDGDIEEYGLDATEEDAERIFALAQDEAEAAFQVVNTYEEKVEATRIRIDAILGRCALHTITYS